MRLVAQRVAWNTIRQSHLVQFVCVPTSQMHHHLWRGEQRGATAEKNSHLTKINWRSLSTADQEAQRLPKFANAVITVAHMKNRMSAVFAKSSHQKVRSRTDTTAAMQDGISPMTTDNEQLFYVHDTTRGYVGNCMVWWRKGHHGYTCDINDAHIFTEDELRRRASADDLVAYPVEYITSIVSVHVDMQKVDRSKGKRSGTK